MRIIAFITNSHEVAKILKHIGKQTLNDLTTPESFIAVVSKDKIIPLATSQDHKAVGDGDVGLNTGGNIDSILMSLPPQANWK